MATLAFKSLRNVTKVMASGESWQTIATRYRRNAGQFKTGMLVGIDDYGNKYYEDESDDNVNNVMGRYRWVEFPASINKRNATMVPPEWHGWLHYTSDLKGPEILAKFGAEKPFLIQHSPNRSGTSMAYTPDNYHKNPHFNPDQATGQPEEQVDTVAEKHYVRARTAGFSIDDL